MNKPSEQAVAIVAQCWCHPTTENETMNVKVGLVLAHKVDEMLALLKGAAELSEMSLIWGEDVKFQQNWREEYAKWMKANNEDAPCTNCETKQ